ncbi:MAG: Lrp/AsnC family transcriptional regulator [Candidatus Hodarchaeota archaeon]
MKLDDVDLEILKILSEDGKTTYHAIAEELKKSPVTIKKHVEELESDGIIKSYGAQIDYEKLGYNIIAVIEITISKGKMLDEEKKISENPHVFGVYDITGDSDALVFARFKDRKELSAMIKDIHKSPNVERTNTHIILNIIKEGTSLSELLEKEQKS